MLLGLTVSSLLNRGWYDNITRLPRSSLSRIFRMSKQEMPDSLYLTHSNDKSCGVKRNAPSTAKRHRAA
jgi:hypothetical protein